MDFGYDKATHIDWDTFDLLINSSDLGLNPFWDCFENYPDFHGGPEWPGFALALDSLDPKQYLGENRACPGIESMPQNSSLNTTSQPLEYSGFTTLEARSLETPVLSPQRSPSATPSHSSAKTSRVTKKRKLNKEHGKKLEGYFCFSVNSDGPTSQQRSRYTASRKAEVNEMRDIGACLRCKVLKKPCSKGTPCQRCVAAMRSAKAAQSLHWMDCARPSLISLSIFKHDNSDWDSAESLSRFNWYTSEYRKADVSVLFDVPFEWEIESLSSFLLRWLVEGAHASELSVTGIMSTTKFSLIISPLVGARLSEPLKAFLYALSCLTNVNLPPQGRRYVRAVANSAGVEVIRELEVLVAVRHLSKLPRPSLFGLFAVLLATIIGLEFCDERRGTMFDEKAIDGPDEQHVLKRAELKKLLTYYMVLVSRYSGILSKKIDEETILEKTNNLRLKSTVWPCSPQHSKELSSSNPNVNTNEEADESVPGLRFIPTEPSVLTYQGRFVSKAATMWFPQCPQFCHYPHTYSFQSHLLTVMDTRESQKRALMPGSLWQKGNFDREGETFRSQFCGHVHQ